MLRRRVRLVLCRILSGGNGFRFRSQRRRRCGGFHAILLQAPVLFWDTEHSSAVTLRRHSCRQVGDLPARELRSQFRLAGRLPPDPVTVVHRPVRPGVGAFGFGGGLRRE